MRVHYLQHVPFEGLGSIADWLAAAGCEVAGTRLFETPRLPPAEDVDFLIVMGGPMSANDEAELAWLAPEKTFIRRCIEDGKPVLGVCLGAQLIASALGARVYPGTAKEIGWFPVRAVRALEKEPAERTSVTPQEASRKLTSVTPQEVSRKRTSVMPQEGRQNLTSFTPRSRQIAGRRESNERSLGFAFPASIEVFHWHGETFDLPPGAVRLAESDACRNQAFQLGRRVLGLQFHLETTPESAREIVTHCRAELMPSRYVQSEAEILGAQAAKYTTINGLQADLLSFLEQGRR